MTRQILRFDVPLDPFELHATVSQQLLGRFDPTGGRTSREFLKVHVDCEDRLAVWRLTRTRMGVRVEAQGADPAAVRRFVGQLPPADGVDSFRPDHPLLAHLARLRGLRLLRYPWPFDIAAGAVLQQRVEWRVGYADFRRVALRWGTRAPAGTAFPGAARLARVPVCRIEALGIDPKRAVTLHRLARAQARSGFLDPEADPGEVRARLLRIPGIGPWTTGLVLGYAYGDPDAVPVGDLHIPSLVTSALAGEEEGTDERMLELIEPYRGHRFRVIRLLRWAARRAPAAMDRYGGRRSEAGRRSA